MTGTRPLRPDEQAGAFDQVAAEYDDARPGYPEALVRWVVPRSGGRILDVGAGTGKLTRTLVDVGHDVAALDHGPALLRRLRTTSPGVPVVRSTAEQLPIGSATVDGIVVAQAWHWFDERRTLDEVARALRPHGHLGLLWNVRDEREGWVRELAALLGPSGTLDRRSPSVDARFTPLERTELRWSLSLSRERLDALVRSRSQVAILDEGHRRELVRQVRQLCDSHPDTRGRSVLRLPYRTVAHRTTLLP